MENDSPLIPEWEELGIPVDEDAEPEDADVLHEASVEDLDAVSEDDDVVDSEETDSE